MVGIQKYTCGAGDGMFDDDNGSWVEVKEYNRLKEYVEDITDIIDSENSGLSSEQRLKEIKKMKL